jgi:hypothetical protein
VDYPYGGGKAGVCLDRTNTVGKNGEPNVLGLYDMHGNVEEWCSDWYETRYYANGPARTRPGRTGGRTLSTGAVGGAVAATTAGRRIVAATGRRYGFSLSAFGSPPSRSSEQTLKTSADATVGHPSLNAPSEKWQLAVCPASCPAFGPLVRRR